MQAPQTGVRRDDAFLALLLATDLLLIIGRVIFMKAHLVVWDTSGPFDNIPNRSQHDAQYRCIT